MFVWLNIIKTHKSYKDDDGITPGKFTPLVSPLVALGILKLKETLATIKCSVHRQKRTPSYGAVRLIPRSVNLFTNTRSSSWE